MIAGEIERHRRKEGDKKEQATVIQEEEDIDLPPREYERALKEAHRSFVMPGKLKTDIDSYFDQANPHIGTLIEKQLKEMGSTKIIMTLWILWKKPIKLLIKLGSDDTTDDIYYE